MEGHIFSVFPKVGKKNFKISKIDFPILTLLVSGGHTELVLIKKWFNYQIIGETVDDAVGEAFDKVARMLELSYPGGPEISKLAEEERKKLLLQTSSQRDGARKAIRQQANMRGAEKQLFSLPRPMLNSKDFNFSYSGLKTAVLYLIKKIGTLDQKIKAEIALEFENAAIECLTHKTEKSIEKYKIKTLIVAGGVSANLHLRKEINEVAKKRKIKLLTPIQELTGDNSLMIGIAGYMNYLKNKKKIPRPAGIKAVGNLRLK
jgi:N6-L-threonylcarbamoyladenine synthase